jgi:hypothetical protein
MRHVVMQCIYSLERGGAQQVVLDLVKHLDHSRFETKVCSITDTAPLEGQLQDLGVETFLLGKRPGSALSGMASLFRLARFFRRERVSLLHTHGFAGNVWSRLGAILARVPALVHTDHNVEVKRREVLLLERFLLASTDMITGISADATANFLRNTGASAEKCAPYATGSTSRASRRRRGCRSRPDWDLVRAARPWLSSVAWWRSRGTVICWTRRRGSYRSETMCSSWW